MDTGPDTETLKAELASRDATIAELKAQVAKLSEGVVRLRKQLGRNSTNSKYPFDGSVPK